MNISSDISLDDFKNSISDIIKELETNPEKINEMTSEQVLEIEKHLSPYGATIYGPEKYTCISFTNLKEKYMQKLLTTALIGFLYQMSSEYTIEDEELTVLLNKADFMDEVENPDKNNTNHISNLEFQYYEELKKEYLENRETKVSEDSEEYKVLTEDEETELRNKVNKKIEAEFSDKQVFNNEKFLKKKEELVNEQSAEEQVVINRFLNKLFKYNPNTHTTSVFNKDNEDPERQMNSTLKDNEFTQVIPPNDTYGRFNYYYDVNYEKLRQAVMYLYNDKPDTEVAINIYDSFDSVEECNEYIEKNQDNVICNLLNLTNYKWNLLGSFKQNRDRISFYNSNTKILENIMKQQEDDAKMGKVLLDARVRKKKVKNIKEYGKDHPSFLKYKQANPNEITTIGKQIEIDENKVTVTEEIEVSETGTKLDDDGTPSDCLEIGVTSINLKDNSIKTGKIYSKAEKPYT
jgi:hypothetical protein